MGCAKKPAPAARQLSQDPVTTASGSPAELNFHYAVPLSDSICFYHSPMMELAALDSVVRVRRMRKKYLELRGRQAAAYSLETGAWIRQDAVRPYYPAGSVYDKAVEPDILDADFPCPGLAWHDTLAVYADSMMRSHPAVTVVRDTFEIVRRRREGYRGTADTSIALPEYYEVFLIRDKKLGITGWVRGQQVIRIERADKQHPRMVQGTIGIVYNEPGGTYVPATGTWYLATGLQLAFPGCCDYWFDPDGSRFMVYCWGFDNEDRTFVVDATGRIVFRTEKEYTSPGWCGSYCLVRGLYDDDAVYKLDLAHGTTTL
ncbi:MAG TPA: hypothetical protein VMF29_01765, partial [Candidatus Edwardsbacteria bacterium]|nr:hypothetical protein [Candidatus Edwardsbacteria bacterium]